MMNRTYKDIYNDIIGKRFQSVVIRYKPIKGTYEYLGFSHKVETEALDDIAELIIDDMVFYAFSEDEIINRLDVNGMLSDLRAAAKYAYIERLPERENANTDGTVGEVLLDIFIQLASKNTKKLIARAKHTELKSKREITGYDALYFTKDEMGICLWLGQAKAGQSNYCKTSIVEDLKTKYKKEYFANTVFYVADKNEAPELSEILNNINKICFLAQKENWDKEEKIRRLNQLLQAYDVKIKIPCLIVYTKEIYFDKTKLESYVMKEVKEIIDMIDIQKFPIEVGRDYEIVFYIMPVGNIDYIRNKIVELKKEAT